MSEHDEGLVERVAQAIAANDWPGYDPSARKAIARQDYVENARAVLDALDPELRHDPPEGCEWVALPTEVVDRYGNRDYEGPIAHACREAQARRPKPEPRTERVPVWEAVGRMVPGKWTITGWSWGTDRGGYVTTDHGDVLLSSDEPEVVVLAEDDK